MSNVRLLPRGFRAASVAVLAALAAGSAAAEVDAQEAVTCRANGYAVIIQSESDDTLAEGTTVAWSVAFVRMEGAHTLDRALEPGDSVLLSNALGSNFIDGERPCEASIDRGR